jgi:hypothetical protein
MAEEDAPRTSAKRAVEVKMIPVPRIGVSPDEAAAVLGVSRDFFDEHILPEIAHVKRGRRTIIPLVNVERWVLEKAARHRR